MVIFTTRILIYTDELSCICSHGSKYIAVVIIIYQKNRVVISLAEFPTLVFVFHIFFQSREKSYATESII